MDNTPADNGIAQNPVENAIGSVNQPLDFNKTLESILFADEQGSGNSEPVEQSEEAQTEDKVSNDGEASQQDEVTNTENPMAEDGNDVPSHEEVEQAEPEANSDGVQKRIDKLTYLRKQAEEQVTKLTSEVESYKAKLAELETVATAPEPTPDNPFGDLVDETKIKTEYENARNLRFKCEENPDGFQIGETYYNAEQVRQMRVNAMKAMEMHLPKQLQFVRHKQEFDKSAIEQYPWYNKPESTEYKLAQEVMKNFKNFKNYPDAKLFIGDYVQGLMLRTAKGIKKNQPAKAVPQMSVKPSSSPTVAGKVDASARNIEARYGKTQSRDDLKKAVSRFL